MKRAAIIGHHRIGAGLALLAAAGLAGGFGFDYRDEQPLEEKPERLIAPNDLGPVVDSTKESKRARRRRLAKEGR